MENLVFSSVQLNRWANWIGGGENNGGAGETAAGASGSAAADALGLEQDEEAQAEQVQQLLQQFSVLLEYERMQNLIPSGMYVMPSFDSVLTWHGAVFARHGLYRGGVFKFQLQLPEDYPDSPPELTFVTEVFHPMVDPQTGRVDIGAIFPEWRPGRDYASFVLPHLHRALLRREYFAGNARPALNAEARELFVEDPAAFAKRAAECAQTSLQNVHATPTGSSLQFTKGPVEAHDKILEALRSSDPSYAMEDRKAMFVDWFCNHYANQRVHVGVEESQVETILVSEFPADSTS